MVEFTKIVINRLHGGFGLSHEAMMRYCEIKGITVYPEKDRFGLMTYYTTPLDDRVIMPDSHTWVKLSDKKKQEINFRYKSERIWDKELFRDDSVLAQVVEELGKAANGQYAKLEVVELPKGTHYYIDEYDGFESVITESDVEWSVA